MDRLPPRADDFRNRWVSLAWRVFIKPFEIEDLLSFRRVGTWLLRLVFVGAAAVTAYGWTIHVLPAVHGGASRLPVVAWETGAAMLLGLAALILSYRHRVFSILYVPFGFFQVAMLHGIANFSGGGPLELYTGFGVVAGAVFGLPVGSVLAVVAWRSEPPPRRDRRHEDDEDQPGQ